MFLFIIYSCVPLLTHGFKNIMCLDKHMFQLLGHLLLVARNVAEKEKLDKGYRVGQFNLIFHT